MKLRLTFREQQALRELVFELSKPHGTRAIARYLGWPHERVLRIERQAMNKLRHLVKEGFGK